MGGATVLGVSSGKDDWPENVTPFHEPKPSACPQESAGRVTPLPSNESTVPWRGDEEWISTLADPHDTTTTDEVD